MRFFRLLVMGIAVLGFMTMSAQAGTIDLIINAFATNDAGTPGDTSDDVVTSILTKCTEIGSPGSLTSVNPSLPGESLVVTYEIAVAVDDTVGSTVPSNQGLATLVFDVMNCGACAGYQMPSITAAESGVSMLTGAIVDVTAPQYIDTGGTASIGYNGGWGFDNSNLPIGGNVTSQLCDVLGAGSLAPLTWDADVNAAYPGTQAYARLGVGIGTYTFPADDPKVGGMQGGFGQVLANVYPNPVQPGDGSWLMFRGTVDITGWSGGAYGWDLIPTNGAVYSPTVDFNNDQGGGFRVAVAAGDMGGDSFAFFLIPEPASLGLLLVGGLALIRRRP
jgi:hypothetical protein